MSLSLDIADEVARINELMLTCKFNGRYPAAFDGKISIEEDTHTVLLGNKTYTRFTFQHGTRLLLTIQSNAQHFRQTNPLFHCEVISVLIRYNGEIINPLLHPMNTRELQDEKLMVLQALQMLTNKLEGKDVGIRSDCGESEHS